MKFSKYCSSLLLLCAVLVSLRKTDAENIGKDGEKSSLAELPILASIPDVEFRGPIAKILVGSLFTISLASTKLSSKNTDFLESHKKLSDQLSDVTMKLSEMPAQLPEIAENFAFFTKMQNDINKLQTAISENMETVLNSNTTGTTSNPIILQLLDYFNPIRQNLKSFVTKYITPKDKSAVFGDVKLFYDFILKKEKNAIERGDDCFDESIQSKLFKTYMFLLQTLSDAYAMVISAHTVQYQKELKANDDTEAAETQSISLELIEQYKSDMKALMEKTKWALDKASRDVRNCGTFDEFKKGVTFDKVSFAHILPKFKDYDYDKKKRYSMYDLPEYQCYVKEEHVKYSFMEISESCTDGDLRVPASLTVYINPRNRNWPYVYVKNEAAIAGNKVLGNETAFALPDLVTRKYYQTQGCYTMFCDAFKKQVVGVSTLPVKVEEGNVITGVRLEVTDSLILHVEIRKGKLLDDLTVDPESLVWAMPEPDTDILYLDSNIRKFELGDIETKNNTYITSIQIVLKNRAEGILGLSVNGEISEPNPSAPTSVAIDLSKSVSPEAFGGNAKNRISEAPQPSKPYHVALQPSDLEKDLGITTIPFFDMREVAPLPASPITGVGFYHQTVKGSGGFISLKVKQSNLARFIDYDLVKKTIDASFNMQ